MSVAVVFRPPMTRTWERTTADGDAVTVTVDPAGIAVSWRRVWGEHEGYTASLDAFDDEWLAWLAGPFDDVIDEIRAAVAEAAHAADDADDNVP